MAPYGLKKCAQNYLKPYVLKSTTVIIDSNISVQFGANDSGDPRLTGDYRRIYRAVREFFLRLKECNITPIIAQASKFKEDELLRTKRGMKHDTSEALSYKETGFSFKGTAFPIFTINVFTDVLIDLDIEVYLSSSEDVDHIQELAKALKCPIISDKYVYGLWEDLTFIPQETLKFEKNSDGSYVECCVFDRERFSNGVDSSLLLYLTVIFSKEPCYNNYNDKICFFDFLLPEHKHERNMSRKYQLILDWMRKNDKIACERKINEEAQKARKTWEAANVRDKATEFRCKINPVEDIHQESIYASSIKIIQGLHGILHRDSEEKVPIAIYMRDKKGGVSKILLFPPDFPRGELTEEQKYDILYEILDFKSNESIRRSNKQYFDDNWYIFVLAFTYWEKECRERLDKKHIYSTILTAFILHVLKNNYKTLTEERKISNLFAGLTKEHYDSAVKKVRMFITERANKEVELKDITHIHMYLTFQNCLNHIMEAYASLDLPQEIRIADFMAGSFYHSIFTQLSDLEMGTGSIKNWFNDCEILKEPFCSLMNELK